LLNYPVESRDVPLVVLVHGLGSSKDSLTNLALEKILLPQGIAVFRFDIYGHGESHGEFPQLTHSKGVESTVAALEYVRSVGYHHIGLVGSSFGGFTSIRATAQSDIPEFLALKSPVVTNITKIFGTLFKDLQDDWEKNGFIEYTDPHGEKKRLNHTFYEDAISYQGYDFAKDIDIPTFIVHGGADEIVPHDQSSGLAEVLPDCHLVTLENADHRYTDPAHFEKMVELLSGFVIERFK
jgi:dipeptidyl aminopeptidase/acylaminoacyl peptidase